MKGFIIIMGIIFLALIGFACWCWYYTSGPGETFIQTCHYGPDYSPDPLCTPGDKGVVDLKIICAPAKYDAKISKALTREVFGRYGINDTSNYRIDNLVPLELGGSNNIRNLYPQPISSPGFNEKNIAEQKLHDIVCANKMPLNSAQQMIMFNWKTNEGLWR